MVEYELDQIEASLAPPTHAAIDRVRQQQLAALQELRRKLLHIVEEAKSAA